ncbi:hypothetical protein CDCA_CDCA17G4347 [Cyanidium caldarium]|uniref:FAD-binding PCMH-type domain-containing protein n=1 Tax=Cyanidium caldarium TaxID=2771 RepID=A0AAV9J142_CYACA|nr:hypothetical protein CDCA_CDCA17G4347 [Cyanidium caldarium]
MWARLLNASACRTTLCLGAVAWACTQSSEARLEAETVGGLDDAATDAHVLYNWSATHRVQVRELVTPEKLTEVEAAVRKHHALGRKLRPVGSALSPNGLAFEPEGMLSLALCDQVLSVNTRRGTVRVQAGARVSQVMEALRPHGLVLQNFASIAEQQIGGFIQAGAHGTGACLPPVDEQVVDFLIVTPARGTLHVDRNSPLFDMLRVGLGAFGVVSEVTLQCVPAHYLLEETSVRKRHEIAAEHDQLLRKNRHVRYMWIPYTDDVVVVCSNPLEQLASAPSAPLLMPERDAHRLAPLRELLRKQCSDPAVIRDAGRMHFAELRDQLIRLNPLDTDWIAQVNRAEAEFWRRSQGVRVDWSDRILGFECGGQQWVSEVAFHAPIGARRDLQFMERLMRLIEERRIPAPAPVEQRWTCSSTSSMSPARLDTAVSGNDGDGGGVFSWVGIIMYLPTEDAEVREQITQKFIEYKTACAEPGGLWEQYDAHEHWAKIEVPRRNGQSVDVVEQQTERMRRRIRERYPVAEFQRLHAELDPKHIMTNELVEVLLLQDRERPHVPGDEQMAAVDVPVLQ